MKLLLVYGTTEGHTRKVANWIAERVRSEVESCDVYDATALPGDLDVGAYDAAIVAASVHQRRHQTAIMHFVQEHLVALRGRPNMLISVSLSAVREEDRADAKANVDAVIEETGWRPDRVELVAGALVYTHYDFFKRQIMKMIVRKEEGPTDTSRDYEFTDWDALAKAVTAFMRSAARPAG